MAVTLTAAELAAALRIGDTPAETVEVTRLLLYVRDAIPRYAPGAPDAVHNEASIRLAGYIYDSPGASRGTAYGNPLRHSGAAAMLLPWRNHRAGIAGPVGAVAVTPAARPVGAAVSFTFGMSDTRDGPIIRPRSIMLTPGIGAEFEISNAVYPAAAGQFYSMDVEHGHIIERLETRPLPSDITRGSAYQAEPSPATGPRRYSVGPAVTLAEIQTWWVVVS